MGGAERVARTVRRVWRSGFASVAAGLLLAVTAACGGDGATEPLQDALTGEEVEFLAAEADAALGAALEGAMSEQAAAIGEGEAAVVGARMAAVGGPAATSEPSPARASFAVTPASSAAEPIRRQFEFQRTVICPEGGAVGVGGTGIVTADPEAGSVEIGVEGSQELVTCARARGELLLSVDGAAIFTAHRVRLRGTLVELVHDLEGAFEVTSSDGRQASCAFDLHATLEGTVVHITGEFCGREVDRTRPVG